MMKTAIKNLILIIMIFSISCSSSGEDDFTDTPPLDSPPSNEASFDINLIEDSFEGDNYLVVGSEGWNFMLAYKTTLNGNTFSFEAIQGALPIVMKDNAGSEYTIFGEAVNGPNEGKSLTPVNAFIGYWFSWGTFYPGLEIYGDNQATPNLGASVQATDDWLIPRNQVFQAAGRDAIPAIDNPQYVEPKDDNRSEDELVVGVRINNSSKSYPHAILDWHEIVNDQIGDISYSVIFCPLTGTATVWNREINGQVTTFGVSGFLYNSNVVPYDRSSNSNWSQMLQQSVQGTNSGQATNNLFALETTLATWRMISNNDKMLSTDTGFNRKYHLKPYGSYPTSSSINFPINFEDNRLHPKERVLGVIINGKAKAYRFSSFK